MGVTVEIGSTFPMGTRLSLNDQTYVLVGSEPYTRNSDGLPSRLLTWETTCRAVDCEQPLRVTTGLRIASKSIGRRCSDHVYTGQQRKRAAHADELKVELP